MIQTPIEKSGSAAIKRIVLFLVGIFCYLYSLFAADFAELHINIPPLDFPIFVGEILLSVSILLLIVAYCNDSLSSLQGWQWVIIFYVFWLLSKALAGYLSGGPLALRNAALFYYPLFALVGYLAFDPRFFNAFVKLGLFIFLSGNFLLAPVHDYYMIPYAMLVIGLGLSLEKLWLKLLGFGIVIFQFMMVNVLWGSSRSHVLGVVLWAAFLLIYFLFGLVQLKARVKVGGVVILGGIFVLCTFQFADPNSIKSMLALDNIRDQFQQFDQEIAMKRKDFKAETLSPNIYNDNSAIALRPLFVREDNKKQESPLSPGEHLPDEPDKNSTANVAFVEGKGAASKDTTAGPEENLLREIHDVLSKTQPHIEESADEPDQKIKIAEAAVSNPPEPLAAAENASYGIVNRQLSRNIEVALNNIVFRLFIWRDMLEDLKEQHAWVRGMGFGHPQRSPSIEILGLATGEWRRDGWITPHNSFLHMIYRGGIVGMAMIVALLAGLVNLSVRLLRLKSVWGGLLLASLFYWIGLANFLVVLEFPYNAIPFWTLLGMTWAYAENLEKRQGHAI